MELESFGEHTVMLRGMTLRWCREWCQDALMDNAV